MDPTEIKLVLEGSEFFRGIEPDHLARIADLCRERDYGPGEYVFRQGDFGENLYVIADGHVALERSVDLRNRVGTVPIAILGKGRVFGCWSTLLDEPRYLMSSAAVHKPTRVITLKGSDLREMMVRHHHLGFNILERLCFLLRDRIESAYGALEKI